MASQNSFLVTTLGIPHYGHIFTLSLLDKHSAGRFGIFLLDCWPEEQRHIPLDHRNEIANKCLDGVISGYRRVLVASSVADLIPHFDQWIKSNQELTIGITKGRLKKISEYFNHKVPKQFQIPKYLIIGHKEANEKYWWSRASHEYIAPLPIEPIAVNRIKELFENNRLDELSKIIPSNILDYLCGRSRPTF